MANALVALGAQAPDVVGSFNEGFQQGQRRDMNQLAMMSQQQGMQQSQQEEGRRQAEFLFNQIGSGAMHALGGNIDGEVDPVKWGEALDYLGSLGLDVDEYRANPQMAKVAAQSSVSALQRLRLAQDDRQFDFLMRKFDEDVRQANQRFAIEQQQDAAKPPTVTTLFDEGTGQEYKAQWNPQTGQFDRVGGMKAPSGMTLETRPDGSVSLTQGNVKGSPKLTEQQSKDLVYYERGAGALPILDKFSTALASPTEATGSRVPLIGNYLKSDAYQQAENAGLEFLQAILRKDTGAAITPQETEEYGKVYLPRPGDGEKVLKQKEAARKRALEAIRKGLGPAEILAAERPKSDDASNGGPSAGDTVDGYRFKGGDPSDPANWEQAQ